ncbi:MAG: LemA family protein [Deltaproteobacteria bacterium]|nr:LemA family protein [Deltaproteobacteria bacterium]
MNKGSRNAIIVIAIIAVLILMSYSYVKGMYNSFVTLDESVSASWAQVENQLQRRYDLIPNLVETVKGFASQERAVFLGVAEARSKVGRADSIPDKIAANNELSGALARLLVTVERYPDIKSDQNFIRLQDELAGTENRIAVERRRYNEMVKTYNIKVRTFPSNLFASMFGFEKATFFEVPEAATAVPQVKFE